MRYSEGAVVGGYEAFPSVPYRNFIQQRFEIPALAAALRLPQGGDLLEVGCGLGIALAPLARVLEPATITAVDIDEGAIAQARSCALRERLDVDVRHADVRNLPFPAESFDLVIDFGTCYHIARPDQALAEVARVLRPAGLFVHESELAQLISHPRRQRHSRLPWESAPELVPKRSALFWATRRKVGTRSRTEGGR